MLYRDSIPDMSTNVKQCRTELYICCTVMLFFTVKIIRTFPVLRSYMNLVVIKLKNTMAGSLYKEKKHALPENKF